MTYKAFIEWKGGLGDIVYGLYITDAYSSLSRLVPGERALVAILCSNPGVRDLLLYHPKKDQIDVRDLGYRDPWGPAERIRHGLPPEPTVFPGDAGPVAFYPSPSDLARIAVLPKRYVVFSLSAGLSHRSVPQEISESAAAAALEAGYSVVLVGRTFENWNQWGDYRFTNTRHEVRLPARAGLVDLIDQLTFPGTAALIQGSAGVFCCESSVMHLCWRLRHPCYVAVFQDQQEWKPGSWVAWGMDLPESRWVKFPDWRQDRLRQWISTLRR